MTLFSSINEFLQHCRYEKNLNQKTLKAYEIDLLQLSKFLGQNHSEVESITKIELRGFLTSISSLRPKSIKRKIASLKVFFNYLEFEDRIAINPLRKMNIKIREDKNLPVVMDIREILQIFKIAYADYNKVKDIDTYSRLESLRNIVVLELLFSTGARVSEIANLKKQSIDLKSGRVQIKGKGNKERFVYLCNRETLLILQQYSKIYDSKIDSAGGYFLINKFGNKLSDQSIRSIIKQLALKACISKHITPHAFRHSFATLLLEKDVDIKYIQGLLGHSSIMTTQIYTHINLEKQKQILKNKHPRKEFSYNIHDAANKG